MGSITKGGSDMTRRLHFKILAGLLVSIAICSVLSENQIGELLEQPSELGPSILELYLAPFGNKDVGQKRRFSGVAPKRFAYSRKPKMTNIKSIKENKASYPMIRGSSREGTKCFKFFCIFKG